MELQRVAVLGGGPGGLYAARLLKLARPSCEVVVHEQGVPDETFGFGVGLAARTQRRLAEADPASLDDILANAWSHDMRMRVGGREAGMDVSSLVAVGRAELLAVLQRHAEDAGVKLEFGARRSAAELDADLVIAADGVGSATRSAGEFGAEVETGSGWYLWAGTDVALDHALFAPERTEHGVFVTHAYPYAADRSTFLVETDEATWRSAGFERKHGGDARSDASDDVALDYLSDVFADHLGGHRLIGNRTRWLQFRTVRCARWHDGRTRCCSGTPRTPRTTRSARARSWRWRTRSRWSRRCSRRTTWSRRWSSTPRPAAPRSPASRTSPSAPVAGGTRSRSGSTSPSSSSSSRT